MRNIPLRSGIGWAELFGELSDQLGVLVGKGSDAEGSQGGASEDDAPAGDVPVEQRPDSQPDSDDAHVGE